MAKHQNLFLSSKLGDLFISMRWQCLRPLPLMADLYQACSLWKLCSITECEVQREPKLLTVNKDTAAFALKLVTKQG